MILLELFLTCFKVGLFTIGGGAAIIPILQQEVVANGWISMEEVLTYIAISESTPGPIAINMATFIGSSQAGFLGALCATFGMVLPSFIIILIIAKFFSRFAENTYIKTVLVSIRPFVVGMILSAGVYLLLSAIGIHGVESLKSFGSEIMPIIITVLLAVIMFVYKKIFKKPIPVIMFIVIAACVGMLSSLIKI
jgi:chromate transporter